MNLFELFLLLSTILGLFILVFLINRSWDVYCFRSKIINIIDSYHNQYLDPSNKEDIDHFFIQIFHYMESNNRGFFSMLFSIKSLILKNWYTLDEIEILKSYGYTE